mmetsp:Transcript_30937/g.81247  ORF Transcript_30937/g.81247 Transcript_30937/m.81247 type:complete len:110 (-) Transcript_30937:2173-2502(-)
MLQQEGIQEKDLAIKGSHLSESFLKAMRIAVMTTHEVQSWKRRKIHIQAPISAANERRVLDVLISVSSIHPICKGGGAFLSSQISRLDSLPIAMYHFLGHPALMCPSAQ